MPVLVFAATRVAATLVVLIAVLVLALPDDVAAAVVLGGLALPWTVAVFILARRRPELVVSPVIPIVDFAVLVLLEVVAPQTLGAVRLAALFLIAAHAHFQGERRGVAVAGLGSLALVLATQIRGDEPVTGDVLIFNEIAFVISALATGLVVGLLRTSESASRLRARGLSRRSLQAESEVRRRVAETLHDGPVQELIALDMILSAAGQAAAEGRADESSRLIEEARELATRNVRTLRDEIIDLGPYAFQELSFDTAVENCIPVWKRRYGFEVMATIERLELAPDVAGDLFRIVQEAVVNAGRHAQADTVSINLRSVDRLVELRVTDNGHGFVNGDPGADAPDHFGLASMRERAELLDGELDIETSALGTRVLVTVPLRQP
jgi:two-component system NarL family sensor kinase